MSDVLTAFLQPQVLQAIFVAVIGPVLIVLIQARRESKADSIVLTPEQNGNGKAKQTGNRRVRSGDAPLVEALASWASDEIDRLRREVDELKVEVNDLKRERALDQQHNRILRQQLAALGVAPLGAPKSED